MEYLYTDLTDTPHLGKIHRDVAASAMTDKTIIDCNFNETNNELKVNFQNALNGADKLILDTIVDNSYVPYAPSSNTEEVFDEAESSTTSGTFQEKLKLSIDLLIPGIYKLEWYYEYSGMGFEGKVELDDSIAISNINLATDVGSSIQSCGGLTNIILAEGQHTIDIDFRRNGILGTVNIRRARLILTRIG